MSEFIAPNLPAALVEKLKNCRTLPSLPAIALKVISLARSPSAGSRQLASIISSDTTLSARMLGAANSAFYGSNECTSLQQAINRIGMDAAMSLALSFSLTNTAKPSKNGLCLDSFWKRSVISAMAVREIKQQLNLKFDVETVFLAAIMQDIGMLALNELNPEAYGNICSSSRSHKQLVSFEEKEFGSCHRQVGFWLATHWGLPEKYTQLIFYSHCPAQEISATNLERRILALSGLLADPWVAEDQEIAMSMAYQAAQEYLNMNEQQFSHLLIQMQDQLPKISQMFEISTPASIDTFNLLQEAKQLLVERNLRLMQKMAQQQEEIELLRKATAVLQEQAKKDPLTGIYNRQHLEQQLEHRFHELQTVQGSLAVVFIDLDFFKSLNDQHGHAVGDTALKAFAEILTQELDSKCLAGRYGGEEFVVLMPGYGEAHALSFAKRIQTRLASSPLLIHKQQEIYISASMGVATYSSLEAHKKAQQFSSTSELIRAADKAMYSAKRTGRNRISLYTKQGSQDLSDL